MSPLRMLTSSTRPSCQNAKLFLEHFYCSSHTVLSILTMFNAFHIAICHHTMGPDMIILKLMCTMYYIYIHEMHVYKISKQCLCLMYLCAH